MQGVAASTNYNKHRVGRSSGACHASIRETIGDTEMRRWFRAPSGSIWLALLIIPAGLIFSALVWLLMLFDPRSWRFDKAEARKLLRARLDSLAKKSRGELEEIFGGASTCTEVALGGAGTEYQIEVMAVQNGEKLLLLGSISDGGLRAFCPLTDEVELSA